VISLDILRHAAELRTLVLSDALEIPFSAGSVTFVLCAGLIEHVQDAGRPAPQNPARSCAQRCAYLSFPPFYSPVGGHRFKPFDLLGEGAAIRLIRAKLYWGIDSYEVRGITPTHDPSDTRSFIGQAFVFGRSQRGISPWAPAVSRCSERS